MLHLNQIHRALRHEGGVSRRLFLAYGASLAAIPSLASQASAADRKVTFDSDPFTLGVASGDPDANSVVLWTRLAVDPALPTGGMRPEAINVTWELAEDEGFKKIVGKGTAVATPQLGHSVHVTARGLQPDHWYWFRFQVGDAVSPAGRTRTLPAADATPDKFRFAFASCQHLEHGWFNAYEAMAAEDLDMVFHLGDYIYEYPGASSPRNVRKHTGPTDRKIKTLDEYRERHMQYRSDPLLSNMHAKCPWYVTWDDHEFDNNYANDVEELHAGRKSADVADFLIQRAAAYQAYYEMMPLRKRSLPKGPHMQLYRKAAFGRLAEFFVLDTRQYRTDQPNGDGQKELNDAARAKTNTLLGKQQRNWLDAGLISSTSTWNILAQQVMMGMVDRKEGEGTGYSMDQWPGAANERMELVKFMADRRVPNPVILTGDIHSNWVNDLRVDDLDPDQPVVATEFVGTSISSGGNGGEFDKLAEMKSENPCVKWHNRERGYVRCTLTPENWTSDYVVVEDVVKPGTGAKVRKSFVVENGHPGAHEA